MLGKRIRKRLIILFFSVSALLLFLLNALLIWVITGPRSLEMVTPYIESALSARDGSYKVNIGSSLLTWESWKTPIAVHIHDVKVSDPKDAKIASFPDVSLRVNLFKLLIGSIDVRSVEVDNPSLLLFQAEDGSISLGFSEPTAPDVPLAPAPIGGPSQSLAAALAAYSADTEETPITRLKSISIRHARIAIKNARDGVFFRSDNATLDLKRVWGTAQGTMVLPLEYEHKAGKVQANFVVDNADKTIKADGSFDNIPSALLRELFPAQVWMKAMNMPLSGNAKLKADFDGHVSSLPFTADAGPGRVDYPDELEKPMDVKKIHIEGELSNRFSMLDLKAGSVDFGAIRFGIEGKFRRVGDDYAIDAGIHTAHMPMEEVKNYWPKSVSPHTRAWVIERISKGEVVKSDTFLHFKPGDLKLKDIPHDALAAALDITGASVIYMPKNPPVTGIDAHLDFTGDTMKAQISKASYLTGTKVTSATLNFPNLQAPDVMLYIDIDVNGPAADVQTFLALPALNKAQKMNLTPQITGNVAGNAKLNFVAFSEHEEEKKGVPDINYALTAKLTDVAQPQFLNKHDVTEANMDVQVDNKGLKASGKAVVNKVPMDIVSETAFAKGNSTTYSIKADLPTARLPDFGLPKLDFLKGTMGVDATFVSSDSTDTSNANIDLTHTAIDMKDHGYVKKEGEKATLSLATERLASGNTGITHFELHGEKYEASGKAELTKQKGEFRSIDFDRLTTGHHDLDQLDYERTDTGFSVKARGRALDLTSYIDNMGKGDKSESLSLDIKVDRVIMGEKRELYNVTALADCPKECDSARVEATLADKTPFTYAIHDGQVEASSDNAGDLLRALNVYDSMYDGKLTLSGAYEGEKIVGKLLIKDFTLKNAPVLTRMFSIASLTGILDTLTGNGISFDKLSAPYEWLRGNIRVKDAKSYGSAIGITATGAVSLPADTYDLEGTLVPSYTLNSLVGKIPLLGNIIVGGEGEGLIALTYSVKGPRKDPSISANPLSVLTPGFMRDVFDIFDKSPPTVEQMDTQQKKPDVQQVTPPDAPKPDVPKPETPTP